MDASAVGADAVVVGAGPAGSATALWLARRGHRVTIVDRARFPRPKPCGEYLNPSAVRALERLGLRGAVGATSVAVSGMYIAGMNGASVWAPFSTGRGWLVPRARLDHILLRAAAAAGVHVIEGFRVDAVSTGPRPMIRGRHEGRASALVARIVIGADGMRSVVARRRGPMAPAAPAHYTIGAHFEGLNQETARGDLHLGDGWYAGAALYGGGKGNVVIAVPKEIFRRAGTHPDAIFSAACQALPSLARLMRGARRLAPFVSVGPLGYARRPAVDDGIALVGDAAATINPMTGEGIAMALHGAELLAVTVDGALRRGDTSRGALAAYERARASAFGDTWKVSRLLQWIIQHPRLASHLAGRLARDPRLACRLLGVVNEGRPAAEILSPGFLVRLVAGRAS